MSGVRITTWLTHEEKAELRRATRDYNATEGYIVRLALRTLLGLPLPSDTPRELRNGSANRVMTS